MTEPNDNEALRAMTPREDVEALCGSLKDSLGAALHRLYAINMLRALLVERDALREAISKAIHALEGCPRVERGAGGMTIDAQIRRTVINGVPAMLVEELYEALNNQGPTQ